MGHFARECHSARVGTPFFTEKTEEGIGEEADLVLRSQSVPKRAREDTEVTAVTEAEADHQKLKKVAS